MANGRILRLKNQFHARWKWLLSFRTKDWRLDDYPVVIQRERPDPVYKAPRFSQHRYRAYVVNWSVIGFGDTPEEAGANLEQNFETIRQNRQRKGETLIRPGANGPIEFATQERVLTNVALSEDFIHRVLGLEWAWISDESSLWDFHTEIDNQEFYATIREIYGVDVLDIQSARLWEIFDRIEKSQMTSTD